jgi:hypothetical protein
MPNKESIRVGNGDEALNAVSHTAISLAVNEDTCERGYASLGWLLLEVAEMQYWKIRHDTFRDYLKSVAMDSKKSPGQLHQYFLTVRDLSDTFSRNQLELMGITKAMQLRKAKDYAIVLPVVVVNAALDSNVTVKELKKIISTTLKMPEEEGDWFDLEAEFMVTLEQRKLLEDAISVAMHTDPITKVTISKSAQMLDIMTKFAMEFLGAHSGDGQ